MTSALVLAFSALLASFAFHIYLCPLGSSLASVLVASVLVVSDLGLAGLMLLHFSFSLLIEVSLSMLVAVLLAWVCSCQMPILRLLDFDVASCLTTRRLAELAQTCIFCEGGGRKEHPLWYTETRTMLPDEKRWQLDAILRIWPVALLSQEEKLLLCDLEGHWELTQENPMRWDELY